jgi:dynein heavy chain, axonemal
LIEHRLSISLLFVVDYTTSEILQNSLEKPLEKKTGRTYGAPGNRRLIYFLGRHIALIDHGYRRWLVLDDFNMPERDQYYTVQAHTIVREYLDYQHWYDRQKLTLKEIRNCQFVLAMNQNAGTFHIDARLQRHFATFAVPFPSRVYSLLISSIDYLTIRHVHRSRQHYIRSTRKCSNRNINIYIESIRKCQQAS